MLQIACVFEGSGHMPVAFKIWPKYCISFEKKLHLLFLHREVGCSEFLKYHTDVCEAFLWCSAEYDNIV